MNTRLKALCAGLALLPAIATAGLPAYSPVTDARLTKPEAGNWLMYRGNYEGWGLQRPQADQHAERRQAGAGLVLRHRNDRRPPGPAHRQ